MMEAYKFQVACCLAACLVIGAAGAHHHHREDGKLKPSTGSREDPPTPVAMAGYGVIQRVLGEEFTGSFNLCQIQANAGENDTFELRKSPAGAIELCATNGVALAKGLYWYLRKYCNATVTWGRNGTGDNLALPSPIPAVPATIRVSSSVKWRYYMNVCTVSYSSAWWDWRRWEREIDWMALHGINLPLAFTGQEYVIAEFYLNLGLTDAELELYFSGPAFLAWNRMGNIRRWGGPLTPDLRKAQFDMQQQILERMRSLGMTPVLPGFSGHVPAALQRVIPDLKLEDSATWGHMNSTFTNVKLMQPSSPHFIPLAKNYYELQTQLMGTDHIYNVDTFNEMVPASTEPAYLSNASSAVFQGMRAADPDAIWLMQGWLFQRPFWTEQTVKPYLSGVPNTGMVILDLYTEARPIWSKFESYYGKQFIWCLLHNFGGRPSLHGNLTHIATQPVKDRVEPGSTMVGVGLTPEAIEQNPVVYEMMLETGWTTQPIDVPSWISDYVYDRYGPVGGNEDLQAAWFQLRDGVYRFNWLQAFLGLLHKRPGIPHDTLAMYSNAELLDPLGFLSPHNERYHLAPKPAVPDQDYGFAAVTQAWRHMISGAKAAQDDRGEIPGPLSYDLVAVGRQVLVDVHFDLVTLTLAAYRKAFKPGKANTSALVAELGSTLLSLIQDLDQLLLTDTNYLLGHWIADAKLLGSGAEERRLLEANARYQITLWGPTGNIDDYAEKSWAGLVGVYYYGRWKKWIGALQKAVDSGKPVNGSAFNAHVLTWEQAWCNGNESHTVTPQPGVVKVSQQLQEKWATAKNASAYTVIKNTKIQGSDIHAPTALVSRDVNQLMMFCDLEPSCVGFSSTGFLKTNMDKRLPMDGCDLYVKAK